ncbi:hypothetical protein EYF80_026977 [Liparis tanakae]|uniref:Uncharacterized protein n=1 Tax=Liparis tanakae TaxID=230148 RepID=A0A4Z2HAV9_9TELE|nr:hypothetical protein EYF80_026977 [Liparis tanakae]
MKREGREDDRGALHFCPSITPPSSSSASPPTPSAASPVSRLAGLTGAPQTPHAEQHAGAHQRGQPDRHGVRAHAAVAQDEAETGQSHAHFEQPQGLAQSGGDQSEDEGDHPVANESREDPLGDKDQPVWGGFLFLTSRCVRQDAPFPWRDLCSPPVTVLAAQHRLLPGQRAQVSPPLPGQLSQGLPELLDHAGAALGHVLPRHGQQQGAQHTQPAEGSLVRMAGHADRVWPNKRTTNKNKTKL